MLKKWFAVLLVFMVSAQSLALPLPVDMHQHNTNQLHSFFHELGQPHSHTSSDNNQFEISYSQEAYEHSNPHQDASIAGITSLVCQTFVSNQPAGRINAVIAPWDPPFLRHIHPPPKA
jgi:hypothetical protein